MKIAVVGAGSAQFLFELADLCALPDVGPYEVALCDIDPSRLAAAAAFSRRAAERLGAPVTVTTHADRRAALDGAMASVVSIAVGGWPAIEADFTIPARYGLRQTVADTLGIGAIMRILRTGPVLAEIARDAVELAGPAAPLLNVTNPMAMCSMAVHRLVPEATMFGLCHSTWMTAADLARRLGVPPDEIEFDGAGVNHQVFITRLEHRGEDLYPKLRALADEDTHFGRSVRADLMRRFGYFPTEDSKHAAEYVPWYLPWDDQVDRFHLPVNPYWERRASIGELFAVGAGFGAGHRDLDIEAIVPTGEYAPQIIRSLVTGEARDLYVNVPNDDGHGGRWIAELPEWGVVEVPARVDGAGVHPKQAAALPPQVAAINHRYLEVCDLAVRALVEESAQHVHHAALLDPATSAALPPDAIASMVDELLAAHRELGAISEHFV